MSVARNKVSALTELVSASRRSLVFVGIFSMLVNLLFLVPPLYMLQIYDRVLTSRSSETLLVLTLVVVWLFVTLGLLEFARSRILIRFGNRLDDGLSGVVYDAVNRLARANPGRGTQQPLHDLATLRQFLAGNAPFALFDAPWVTIYLAILFLFHPAFGWFALAATLAVLGIAFVQDRMTRDLQREQEQNAARLATTVGEQLRQAELVHAMGMQGPLSGRWFAQHADAVAMASRMADHATGWSTLSRTLRLLFQSLMLGLGAYLAIGNAITAGMVIAGSILLGRALAPVDQLIAHWRLYRNARVAYERLHAMLADMPGDAVRMPLPRPTGRLELSNVVMIPPHGRKPVLQGVSFGLAAGDVLVVTGASGAGKSALLRSMLGIWPLTAGNVRLDGSDIAHWNREDLAPHVGYLPQDIELFAGTVAENIARFGELKQRRVIAAAQLAGVHDMISALPGGYDTRVGPGGVSLSGGQRQGIALARALYGRPSLVVLDEPAANLDRDGELAVRRACRYLKKHGVTVVMVTHRAYLVDVADSMLVLERGRVKAFGACAEVLQQVSPAKREVKVARRHIEPVIPSVGTWA
jgi:ATP-binding cassette subfamily C protein EexD